MCCANIDMKFITIFASGRAGSRTSTDYPTESTMKKLARLAVSFAALATLAVFAESAQSAQGSAATVSPSRVQVYQELVAARNDGFLAQVNKLYAHH